jgi:hypothetical protein
MAFLHNFVTWSRKYDILKVTFSLRTHVRLGNMAVFRNTYLFAGYAIFKLGIYRKFLGGNLISRWKHSNCIMKGLFNPLNAELNPVCHLLILLGDLTFMGTCIVSIFQYISNKLQRYTVSLCLETALHVSGGTSTHHRHPQHTQTGFNSSTIAADSSNGVTNTRCCRYSWMRSRWWVELPHETCRVVSRYK